MPALRIRRCLPAGLNGRGRQMFVVVNKICERPGPLPAAACRYRCLTISRTTRKGISIQPALTAPMEAKAMTSPVPRATVEAFYRALANRDMDTLATFLDDQVKWTISGPVDILPFCGQRVGKAVVMELLVSDIPSLLEGRRFVP